VGVGVKSKDVDTLQNQKGGAVPFFFRGQDEERKFDGL